MTFRQPTEASGMADRENTVELWDGEQLAATIHTNRAGIHLECAPGWEPDSHGMAIEVQRPFGVVVGLRHS